jgi:malate synthase
VGDARQDESDVGTEDRTTQGGRQHCLGVVTHCCHITRVVHYHEVDVQSVQKDLETVDYPAERNTLLDDMLMIPVATQGVWSDDEVRSEVENNAQGILGYIVQWIHQGIGCSRVPDINNIGLTEDRATLRISSLHIANWMHHGVVTREFVEKSFIRMREVVDVQNARDRHYQPMAAGPEGTLAFKAGCALVFEGQAQPSGYTEPLLHEFRVAAKAHRLD